MAEEQAGFRVGETFYPWPQAFRLGDPVLIREVTGMSWQEFIDALDGQGMEDPAVLNGMIAAAVWQANPRWKRDRVRAFVEAIGFEELDLKTDSEEEQTAGPPPENGSVTGGSPVLSNPDPAGSSDETTPASSGAPSSPTTSDGAPPIT